MALGRRGEITSSQMFYLALALIALLIFLGILSAVGVQLFKINIFG